MAFFTAAELVRPYYFFQDDNRDIFLPFYLHNYRAALDGQLAQFNFFQSLGKPHFASGQVAAFSPVPYISIFLSQAIFGHVFAGVDILVLIYLLLGAAGTVFVVRLLGFSGTAGVFAAVSWTITPFNMLTSQSWTTYPPVIGLLPWILAGALMIYRQRMVAGAWIFVLSHLALFYVGAPQFMLYAAFVEAGVIVLLTALDLRARVLSRPHILRALIVYALLTILVTGLCMPLLLPMLRHVELSAFRGGAMSDGQLRSCSIGVSQLLNGLFLPMKSVYARDGWEWCGTMFPASFTHLGYAATFLLIGYAFVRRGVPDDRRRVIDACFGTAFVLFLAASGFLTPVVQLIPMMNRFRWPFKYFGFATFLLAVCTAPVVDALLARVSKKRLLGFALIAFQAVNLTVADLTFPTQAFMEHLDPVPLTEPLRDRLHGARIISLGWKGESQKHTIASLAYDYATLWELHYFGGYDPLVPWRNYELTQRLEYIAVYNAPPHLVPVKYFRHWGVRWYVLNKPYDTLYEPTFAQWGLLRLHEDQRRVVLGDPHSNPLVEGRGCTMRSIDRVGDDLRTVVDCARPAEVRLRFLYFPQFSATIDGKPAPLKPTASGQILLPVPAGRHEIRLMYDDPLIDMGLWIALVTACAGAVVALLLRERRRKRGGIV